jgi:hypothetical protein
MHKHALMTITIMLAAASLALTGCAGPSAHTTPDDIAAAKQDIVKETRQNPAFAKAPPEALQQSADQVCSDLGIGYTTDEEAKTVSNMFNVTTEDADAFVSLTVQKLCPENKRR